MGFLSVFLVRSSSISRSKYFVASNDPLTWIFTKNHHTKIKCWKLKLQEKVLANRTYRVSHETKKEQKEATKKNKKIKGDACGTIMF